MSEEVTFDQIMGGVGTLLFLWSAIERAAQQEVARSHGGKLPKYAHGIAAVLNAWEVSVLAGQKASPLRSLLASKLRDRLREPLETRNGVCHGLVGVSAGYHGQPASLTWELNDVHRNVSWDEMQTTFSWLARVPAAISMISSASFERRGTRMTDTAENRAWWLGEYGLEVPELGGSEAT